MSILVSGSVAFDHIMVFPDRFVNHILPDKVHALNVSFNIASLKTHFGGVAANICDEQVEVDAMRGVAGARW